MKRERIWEANHTPPRNFSGSTSLPRPQGSWEILSHHTWWTSCRCLSSSALNLKGTDRSLRSNPTVRREMLPRLSPFLFSGTIHSVHTAPRFWVCSHSSAQNVRQRHSMTIAWSRSTLTTQQDKLWAEDCVHPWFLDFALKAKHELIRSRWRNLLRHNFGDERWKALPGSQKGTFTGKSILWSFPAAAWKRALKVLFGFRR